MTVPKVKICGLKTTFDVESALEAGADYIGLVFFPKSPRHLKISQAIQLANTARGKTKIVALLVNPDDNQVIDISSQIKPDYIQLHGHESPQRVAQIQNLCNCAIIKAVAVATASDFEAVYHYEKIVDLILLDAKPAPNTTELPGGNGIAFDWTLLKNQKLRRPYMLAGGLTPDNIGTAITLTNAPILDVSSGVESKAGIKDHQKIKDFIFAAKKGQSTKPSNETQ